jgi:hypothetical protein
MWGEHNLAEDLRLNPGDMVLVPQNAISKLKSFIPAPGLGLGMPVP